MPVLGGAKASRCFTIKPFTSILQWLSTQAVLLYAAMAAHTPWSARTHHPPTVPVSPRLLLCGSLSPSLPLSLSPACACDTGAYASPVSVASCPPPGGPPTNGQWGGGGVQTRGAPPPPPCMASQLTATHRSPSLTIQSIV